MMIVKRNIIPTARSVGSTHMNQASSRSHAIFTITVECSEKVILLFALGVYDGGDDGEDDCDDPLSLSFAQGVDKQQHFRVGKLHLVDLAGRLFGHKTSLQFRQLTKNYHFCWSCQSCYVRSKNHFCLCKLQTNSCSNDFLSQAFPS